MGNQNGRPRPPAVDVLIIMTRLQNITVACHYIELHSRQAAVMFAAWSSFSKILIPSTAKSLGPLF